MPESHRYVRVDVIIAEGIAVWDDEDTTLLVYDGQSWVAVDVIELAELDFMFDGPPGPESPRFIETHDAYTGRSVGWGQWIDNGDGTWSLIGLATGLRRQGATDA